MVTITREEELMGQCVDEYALPFLYEHLHGLQEALDVEDIGDYGPIVLMESVADWDAYEDIGLSEPFEDSPVEWVRRILVEGRNGSKTLYCACVVMNNEYAVSIVFGDDVVTKRMRGMLNELLEGTETERMSLDAFMEAQRGEEDKKEKED